MRKQRIIALVMVFCLSFSCFMITGTQNSFAASKSKVYVITKMDAKKYDEDDSFVDSSKMILSVAYYKNGLVKTGTMSNEDGSLKQKTKLTYKNKTKLKSSKSNLLFLDMKVSTTSKTFTTNSKGLVTKYKYYNDKGKLEDVYKFTWNKRNKVTKERRYSAKGKLKETKTISYSADGKRKSTKTYSANGKLKSKVTYEYKENMHIDREYDPKGKQISITYVKLDKHGNRISQEQYDMNGNLTSSAKYTYRLVKTSKKTIVKGQQEILADIAI